MKKISLILLICVFISGLCFGQQADTLIYTNPEIIPAFQYDTCTCMGSSVKKYFMENYRMPKNLIDNGYTGRIMVEFVVEKDSSLSNIKLIRGIHEPLDKSVIETIKKMHKWIPGINNECSVRTRFILPVSIEWLYGSND